MDRTIAVRFDSNVAPGLSWRFSPEKPEVKVKLGETTTVYYKVTNTGDRPSTGIATYNVQPDLAGTYFSKLECFCFTEQTLQPGETLESAVVFYVDPRLVAGFRREGSDLHHPLLHLLPLEGRASRWRRRHHPPNPSRNKRRDKLGGNVLKRDHLRGTETTRNGRGPRQEPRLPHP